GGLSLYTIFFRSKTIMAFLSDNSIKIRGKLGDKIYKELNGKIYVSKAPVKINYPKDSAAVQRRERFAITQKLNGAVRKLPPLAYLWKHFCRPREVYGKLFQDIFHRLNNTSVNDVRLFPIFNLTIEVTDFNYLDGKLLFTISPLNKFGGVWSPLEVQINVHGVILSYNDEPEIKNKFRVIPFSGIDQRTVTDAPLSFQSELSPVQQDMIAASQSTVILFTFITSNQKGIPEKNSATFFETIK
ncbi:MAG: hypothetical protein ACM3RX_04350, partial [Methanococcaceae archaeon]